MKNNLKKIIKVKDMEPDFESINVKNFFHRKWEDILIK